MRDNLVVGSAAVTSGFAVLGEADSAANTDVAFFESYSVRSHGKLPAVQ